MNWYYDTPTDETADWNSRVVLSENMIVAEYGHSYIHDIGSDIEGIDPSILRERLISDWVVTTWGAPTDMPPGEYITSNRRK